MMHKVFTSPDILVTSDKDVEVKQSPQAGSSSNQLRSPKRAPLTRSDNLCIDLSPTSPNADKKRLSVSFEEQCKEIAPYASNNAMLLLPLLSPSLLVPRLKRSSSLHAVPSPSGLITRNTSLDMSDDGLQRRKICDAITVASIVTNCAGVETSKSQCLGLREFREFLEDYQEEHHSDEEIIALMQVRAPWWSEIKLI